MHKKLWDRARGFDERYGGWGFQDTDLGLRLSQRHAWLGLSTFGVNFFHMGHAPVGRRVAAVQAGNPHDYNGAVEVNNDDWGLGEHQLSEHYAELGSVSKTRAFAPDSIQDTEGESRNRL